MPFRHHLDRNFVLGFLAPLVIFVSIAPIQARTQDEINPKPEQHGRKYKAPPDTSRIEVTVIKEFNKKPIDGAHVVFHPVKDGKDVGNLELKTHPDGRAVIDVIPTGSSVRIQVIADGFATFAEDYQVNEADRKIVIAMIRPREQVSTYTDNQGRASQRSPGVQEPVRPKKTVPATPAIGSGSKPQP